jgi:hypothetical protein
MMALAYPFLAVLDLFFDLLIARLLVNWWAPAFADGRGYLPKWLAWFQTFDASLDAGWQDGYFKTEGTPAGFLLFLLRVRWLYRNSSYGFSYWVLGVAFDPTSWKVLHYEDTPDRTLFIALGEDGLFNVYYFGHLGTLKLGWKAWNYWRTTTWRTTPWGPEWRTAIAASYTPFKRKG